MGGSDPPGAGELKSPAAWIGSGDGGAGAADPLRFARADMAGEREKRKDLSVAATKLAARLGSRY